MKKDNKLLIYASLILLSLYFIHYSDIISLINPTISSKATTGTFGVTIIVTEKAEEAPSGVSGVTGSISGGGGTRTGEIVREIEPPKPVKIRGDLFDVSLSIPEKYRELSRGDKLLAEINIINLNKIGLVSINIEYTIETLEKEVIYKEYETKVIENDISYIKEIEHPLDLNPGYYMLFARIKYKQDIALAGYPFKIKEKEIFEEPESISIYIITALILLAIIAFLVVKLKKIKGKAIVQSREKWLLKQIKSLKRGKRG